VSVVSLTNMPLPHMFVVVESFQLATDTFAYVCLTQVRCWEVQDNGQTVPKAQQMHTGPVLDVCWSDVRSCTHIIISGLF